MACGTHRLVLWSAWVVSALGASAVVAQIPPPVDMVENREIGSKRSHELVDLRCRNELTRREVTLFANGTVRVKQGKHDDVSMLLGDLDPITLKGYTERFTELSYEEIETVQNLPTEGDWVESCVLALDFPDRPRIEMAFSRFDSLPLNLKRAVDLTEELAALTEPVNLEQLPVDYDPRPGDVLRHRDGNRYLVVGKTVDLRGVELEGMDNPLTIYIDAKQLRRDFGELISRKSFF